MRSRNLQHGFTLVEMIAVMVITSIVVAIVIVILKNPIDNYVSAARRAELTDIADTALQRMARDIRNAVPNSLRLPIAAGSAYVEFLPTSGGGRYRASPTGGGAGCGAAGDQLTIDGTTGDTCFEVIGPAITFVANDQIIVGSTQSDGNPPYDNTVSGVRRAYAGVAGTQSAVTITGTAISSAFAISSQRFQIVSDAQQAVTYSCEGLAGGVLSASGDGQGTLKRYWRYGYNTTQLAPPLAGSSAVLASNVNICSIAYASGAGGTSNGLIAITLGVTKARESVKLYHEVHVSNAP